VRPAARAAAVALVGLVATGAAGPAGAEGAPPPEQAAEAAVRVALLARLSDRTRALDDLLGEGGLHGRIEALGRRGPLVSAPVLWPVHGRLTSGFGRRRSPWTGRPDFHAGVDIAARPGTRIRAPGAGTVVFAGERGALGRAVILDHGGGIRTVFGHASRLFVRPGQRVRRGQPIAAVGSSGRSTGPHLHYTVLVNGEPIDPRRFLLLR